VEGPISGWWEHISDAPDGTKDEAMRLWQFMLWEWDFLPIAGIDGVKGPATRAAQKAFEVAHQPHNSHPNGKPSEKAWAILMGGPPVEPAEPEVVVVEVEVEVEVIPPSVRELVNELHGEVN